ncbi:MAG: carboxymuconolactone decarboxylase family protein [Candidatus Desulforudis sp.]|nr:carboxymuconolactone decarboxylase family protein [Desulforudis sp.]
MSRKSILTRREYELIAIGASIAANCGSCLLHHVEAARAAGATDEEMREAVAIGELVKAEPSSQLRLLAAQLLNVGEQNAVLGGGRC